ncbi:ribokinase [Paenibacillus sepulcri]|uniref:Ribokinase n=1 Tax=Paenibacillus sepulcri TaxID=359917 RepID=A0ABS7C524_9BACL|nr:ribokinase [Paenibacillus sepulcri]
MGADMPDIVVFGTINMDYVSFLDHLPEIGETISTKVFGMFPGGKAANQAVAASRLGSKVSLIGRVGDDELGRKLKEHLGKDGVCHDLVQFTPESQTGISMICVDKAGRNTIVTHSGASDLWTKQDIDAAETIINQAKYAMLQIEMDMEIARYIITKARLAGVKLVLNLAPVIPIDTELLSMVDYLIVNETEASQLADITVNSVQTSKAAAQILFERGIQNVIITLGEAGAVLKTATLSRHFQSPKVEVVDSTAAGDCFVAATTHFLCKEKDLEMAIQKAVEVAALSVTKAGAQTSAPTYDEYMQFKQKNQNYVEE